MVVCTGIIWFSVVAGIAAVQVEPSLTEILQQVQLQDWSADHLRLEASVKRRDLQKSGLHRVLVTSVHVHVPVDHTGHPTDAAHLSWPVIVAENITQDVYVDLDEVASLAKFGGPQVIASAYMDTEKPAAVSSSHTVLVYSRLQDYRATVELPLHLRYQAPSDSLYKVVPVLAPRVLVQCWHQQDGIATHLPVCTEGKDTISVLKLPCNATTTEYCYWTPAITDADSTGANTLQVNIPCGLKDHTVLVVIGTVSMTVLGTLYLAYAATTVAIR